MISWSAEKYPGIDDTRSEPGPDDSINSLCYYKKDFVKPSVPGASSIGRCMLVCTEQTGTQIGFPCKTSSRRFFGNRMQQKVYCGK